MNHWLFITAAYALTLLSILGILGSSWRSMRRAEALAAQVGRAR